MCVILEDERKIGANLITSCSVMDASFNDMIGRIWLETSSAVNPL